MKEFIIHYVEHDESWLAYEEKATITAESESLAYVAFRRLYGGNDIIGIEEV